LGQQRRDGELVMTSDEADEVLGIVQRIGPVVLSTATNVTNAKGAVATALRRAVGMLIADDNMINQATFAYAFSVCVELARNCGATLVTMDRVRLAALAETPVSQPAIRTVLAIVRITLACEARILSFMQFASRDEVDTIATAVNAAFSQTEEEASNDLDAGTYMALIRLHGDVVTLLATTARLLPRVIQYNYTAVMPALRMAQRAYADPSRFTQLIAENSVCHPAFMPREGKMLAV
jgi:prophage DNA circulation protein